MKPIVKKRGLILNSKEFKDNSRIITVLTEEGLENYILRGCNKLNSGTKKYTIVPNYVEFLYAKSTTLSTFTEGYILNNYTAIKDDQIKMFVYMAIVEKMLAFCDHIDNIKVLYDFIIDLMDRLDKTAYPYQVLALFEIKLLYLLGIAPNLSRCVNCEKNSDELLLSISAGGGYCKSCSIVKNVDLNLEQTKLFKFLYLIKKEKIDEEFLKLVFETKVDFNDFIDQYYEKYIDFKSKTKKIIRKVV